MSEKFFIFIGSLAKDCRYRLQRHTCFFLKNKVILEHHHKDTNNLFNGQINNVTILQNYILSPLVLEINNTTYYFV